jgi:hypothetical protein
MYLKFSMDPYPNSVHEDHLKHKAPKINVQNSTSSPPQGEGTDDLPRQWSSGRDYTVGCQL